MSFPSLEISCMGALPGAWRDTPAMDIVQEIWQ
jgi:hypothetical protein